MALPSKLLSPLRLVDTDTEGWVRNKPASSGLPNRVCIASVLHPDTTTAQRWQITNTEIHLGDKPLFFLCISVLASASPLKTHRMISYSRNNSVFSIATLSSCFFFFFPGCQAIQNYLWICAGRSEVKAAKLLP